MFTGIVEGIGVASRIRKIGQGYHITVQTDLVLDGTKLGDSIAVNGVCTTVTQLDSSSFTVGLAPETQARTNLMNVQTGERVHLERALTPTSRMGGHVVQGHIDGPGRLIQRQPQQDALWLTVQTSPELMRYIVPKGFITLDGASLTVVHVLSDRFTVTLVNYTQQHITLPERQPGYIINIEVDILGKYVEKLLGQQPQQVSEITFDFLAQHGFQ